MSDQEASPTAEMRRLLSEMNEHRPTGSAEAWAEAMKRSPGGSPSPWWPMVGPTLVRDDDGVVLSTDDTLRVREQALYAAALITECTPFPEDDSEKVVEMAKRFERYVRSGQ